MNTNIEIEKEHDKYIYSECFKKALQKYLLFMGHGAHQYPNITEQFSYRIYKKGYYKNDRKKIDIFGNIHEISEIISIYEDNYDISKISYPVRSYSKMVNNIYYCLDMNQYSYIIKKGQIFDILCRPMIQLWRPPLRNPIDVYKNHYRICSLVPGYEYRLS